MADVPVGAILPFYGGDNQLPSDYLVCNGEQIAKTAYPELYGHLVMANPELRIDNERAQLPDLRGEFLRGWDNGKRVDPDRKLGSPQPDALKEHSHNVVGNIAVVNLGSTQGQAGRDEKGSNNWVKDPKTTTDGDRETRPRNVAVNFIIRARS